MAILNGTSGSDVLTDTVQDDTISGLAGHDAAVFNSFRRPNTVTGASGNSTIVSPEGTDTTTSVEELRFRDGTIHYDQATNAGIVYRLYDTLLDRAPDGYGFGYAVQLLSSGSFNLTLANDLAASPEFQARFGSLTDSQFVDILYHNALNRAPEAAGATFWLDQLAGGASRSQVALGISDSVEHRALTQGAFDAGVYVETAPASDIARLYHELLGRDPEAGGLGFWIDAYTRGFSLTNIAAGMLGTPEGQAKIGSGSDAAFVTMLYHDALDREPDAPGQAYWLGQLSHGASRADVAVAFEHAPEVVVHLQTTVQNGVRLLNTAPSVAGPLAATVQEDGAVITVDARSRASDPDFGDKLSVVVGGQLPPGVSFDASTHSFSVDPHASAFQPLGAGQSASYTVSYGVTDGRAVTPSSFTLTVNGTNDIPVVGSSATGQDESGTTVASAIEDGPKVTLDGLANVTDADAGATLSVVPPTSLPPGVTFDPATNVFTLDPGNAAYQSLGIGGSTVVTVSYGVTDGTATVSDTVSWQVSGVNDAPVAAGDAYTTAEGTTLAVPAAGVLANDTDIDGAALRAVLVTGPAHGTLTLNQNGSFGYTPEANYNGADSFTYHANDGTADSATTTVSLTITPVNDAPVAAFDAYTTAEDISLSVQAAGVLANDTDVDGDVLKAVLVSGPAHGTLTLNPNGSFGYTPDADYNGADSFTYRANDGIAESATTTVGLTITPVNDAPVAVADAYTTAEDTALTVAAAGVLTNDTDADGDVLKAVLVSGPAHGTLTLNPSGSFGYTPDANYNGADSFTYHTNDGTADSATATVSLTVTSVNDAPVAAADAYATAEDTTLTVPAAGILANDGDVDGDALKAVLVTGPAHGTLTLNQNGSFTYMPDANYNGADSFTYHANDGTADSATTTVSLTITPVNDAPVAAPDVYTTAEDTVLVIPAAGVLANDTDVDGDMLKAVLVTAPTHGALSLNQDGSFSYTPDANYNGIDSFTYRANDGTTNSSATTVSLNVTPVNDAPITNQDSYTTYGDSFTVSAAGGVLANDSDVEGDVLKAVLVTGPAHGTLTLSQNGSFIYTPNANFTGDDSFTYQANDGTADSAATFVNLKITGPQAGGVTGAALSEAALNTAQGALVTGSAPSNTAATTTGTLDYVLQGQASTTTPFTWSTAVTATDPETSANVPLTSGGDSVIWSIESGSNGQVLLGTATGTGAFNGQVVAKAELTDFSTSSYKVTLLGPVDHPDADQAGAADTLALAFGYTVTDEFGRSATGGLTIQVQDDAPVTHDFTVTGSSAATANTNLELIVDVSGSEADASGLTGLTKLDVIKASLNELLDAYNQLGNVAVRVVTFSSSASAAGSTWSSIDQAKTYIAGLTPGGSTNYDAAIAASETAYTSTGKIVGADNVIYFLSDGQPNPTSAGLDNTERAAYENFLATNQIKSFALGIGASASGTTSALAPIAYDGTTGTQIAPVVVTNLSQLSSTLTETIAPAIANTAISLSGNVFGIAGADQPTHIGSTVLDGITYTVAGADPTTHVFTHTDSLGSVFSLNFDNGSYSYRPLPNLQQDEMQAVGIKLVDADHDTSSSTLTLHVTSADVPPIARDDLVITNISGSGSTITIPDAALLYNDSLNGKSVTVSIGAGASDGTAVHSNGQFTFFDDDTDGGSFHYAVTDTASLADDGTVTINRAQAGSNTLAGTGLNNVLIGHDGAVNTITGYGGNDYLIGGNLNDTLIGDGSGSNSDVAGNDILYGRLGNDLMSGGAGHDTFLFAIGDFSGAPATDTISDFTVGTGGNSDVLKLDHVLFGLSASPTASELANYLYFSAAQTTVLQIDANGLLGGVNVNEIINFSSTNLCTHPPRAALFGMSDRLRS